MSAATDFRFATFAVKSRSDDGLVEWRLKRHCALRPSQLAWFYLSLCALSLTIAGFFWFQGATMVMPFAWLELAVVGAFFLLYARHAGDGSGALLVLGIDFGDELLLDFRRGRATARPAWFGCGRQKGLRHPL